MAELEEVVDMVSTAKKIWESPPPPEYTEDFWAEARIYLCKQGFVFLGMVKGRVLWDIRGPHSDEIPLFPGPKDYFVIDEAILTATESLHNTSVQHALGCTSPPISDSELRTFRAGSLSAAQLVAGIRCLSYWRDHCRRAYNWNSYKEKVDFFLNSGNRIISSSVSKWYIDARALTCGEVETIDLGGDDDPSRHRLLGFFSPLNKCLADRAEGKMVSIDHVKFSPAWVRRVEELCKQLTIEEMGKTYGAI